MKNAGASITSGLANQHGIEHRVVTDDHPGSSIAVAVLLRIDAQSNGRMCTAVRRNGPLQDCFLQSSKYAKLWQITVAILLPFELITASGVAREELSSHLFAAPAFLAASLRRVLGAPAGGTKFQPLRPGQA